MEKGSRHRLEKIEREGVSQGFFDFLKETECIRYRERNNKFLHNEGLTWKNLSFKNKRIQV